MKKSNNNSDNLIQFKSLVDKDEINPDELKKSGIFEFFDKIFSDKLSESDNDAVEDDLYEEIVDNYFVLLKELRIESFDLFSFACYDYCREIIVDDKEYDLDGEFSHNDADATEALSAIDCLISDLDKNEEEILKTVEKMINQRNTDR